MALNFTTPILVRASIIHKDNPEFALGYMPHDNCVVYLVQGLSHPWTVVAHINETGDGSAFSTQFVVLGSTSVIQALMRAHALAERLTEARTVGQFDHVCEAHSMLKSARRSSVEVSNVK